MRCNQEKECVNEDWRETERGEGKTRTIAVRCGGQLACCTSVSLKVGDRSKLSGCGEFDGVGTIVPCLTG